ncbi:unnamed protein product [Closterium sp. Yama58-4]|nr:unnamed protein product [Closterium sp. Yama58-4]
MGPPGTFRVGPPRTVQMRQRQAVSLSRLQNGSPLTFFSHKVASLCHPLWRIPLSPPSTPAARTDRKVESWISAIEGDLSKGDLSNPPPPTLLVAGVVEQQQGLSHRSSILLKLHMDPWKKLDWEDANAWLEKHGLQVADIKEARGTSRMTLTEILRECRDAQRERDPAVPTAPHAPRNELPEEVAQVLHYATEEDDLQHADVMLHELAANRYRMQQGTERPKGDVKKLKEPVKRLKKNRRAAKVKLEGRGQQ